MFTSYQVVLKFQGKLMGGVPKHPDVIKSWLEARMPTFAPPDAVPLVDLAAQVAEAVDAMSVEENKVWTGFKSDDQGLYVDGYHLKAHLKDVANILQGQLGIKALKSKVANRVFVVEDKLYLGKMEADGFWEHAVHVMTMQGPRSALKRNDYVEQPSLSATLKVLDDNVITTKVLEFLFEMGAIKGFGAERGLGHGRYDCTLTVVQAQIGE